MSVPDIAEALGITAGAARTRVHRSRLSIRKHLSEHLQST
jgi:DNA-directed RNA polymerase specialized sigma24 family protein